MAFTITFRSSEPPTPVPTLAEWLTERGEPFVEEGDQVLALRALPVRFLAPLPALGSPQPTGLSTPALPALQAQIEIVPAVQLTRIVDTLFEVSARAGTDVHLAGFGAVTRSELWLRLADEQDRLRIALALRQAREHGNADEVHKRLWALIASLRDGHDDRWDTATERVVEMLEVGVGLSLEDARWHAEDPKVGDAVAVPVSGLLHCLAWRWLSEAYPGLL